MTKIHTWYLSGVIISIATCVLFTMIKKNKTKSEVDATLRCQALTISPPI